MGDLVNNRNKNVDIFRAISLLIVVIYHSWVLTGATEIGNDIINKFIKLGGEIGVTAFFLLSGYGIYMSLDSKKELMPYRKYIIKRIQRILPHYYVNLIVVLLLTGGVGYIAKEQLKNLVSHFLLIHNFSIDYSGTINGVLWTMPVIFQFYLVAMLLYKLIKKCPWAIFIVSIIFTICAKMFVFKYIGSHSPYMERYGEYAFFLGRQLITALDNFVLGMAAAYVSKKIKRKLNVVTGCVISLCLVGILYGVCSYGVSHGIHTNNMSGYIWHSMVALVLSIIIVVVALMPETKTIVGRFFVWMSKYEYGVYLWHLIIMLNLIGGSPWINGWLSNGKIVRTCVVLIAISVFFGIMLSIMVDGLLESVCKKKEKEQRTNG